MLAQTVQDSDASFPPDLYNRAIIGVSTAIYTTETRCLFGGATDCTREVYGFQMGSPGMVWDGGTRSCRVFIWQLGTTLPFDRTMPRVLPEDVVEYDLVPFGVSPVSNRLGLGGGGFKNLIDYTDPITASVLNIDYDRIFAAMVEDQQSRVRWVFWPKHESGCTDSEPIVAPTSSFTWSSLGDNEIRFDGSGTDPGSSNAATYLWNFGDGSPIVQGPSAIVDHRYDEPGTYRVLLRVTNRNGVSHDVLQNIEVLGDTKVNSVLDRAKSATATGCDTGQMVGDAPECTLRAAIELVNEGDLSRIEFDIDVTGVPRIALQSALPAILHPVTLDGTTQSAGRVEISGGGMNAVGLDVRGGMSTLKGLVVNGFTGEDGVGIGLRTAGQNTLLGNYVGTNAAGTAAAPNRVRIAIATESGGNQIGGPAAGEGNVVSGNLTSGVLISGSSRNRIYGNLVGTNSGGSAAIPNEYGIVVARAGTENDIGGTGLGQSNQISGNSTNEIFVLSPGTNKNRIVGNLIGVDSAGAVLPSERGIHLVAGNANVVRGNTIAATDVGVSVSSRATFEGGEVIQGANSNTLIETNRIGLDRAGRATRGTALSCVVISAEDDGPAVSGTMIRGNQIAGCAQNVLAVGQNVTGSSVVDNVIGLAFDGSSSLPTGAGRDFAQAGVRVDGAPETTIEGNRIAGHQRDLLLAGSRQSGGTGFDLDEFEAIVPGETERSASPTATGLVARNNTTGLLPTAPCRRVTTRSSGSACSATPRAYSSRTTSWRGMPRKRRSGWSTGGIID